MKKQDSKTRVRNAKIERQLSSMSAPQLWKVGSGGVALGSPPVKQPITPGIVEIVRDH
jgi:hypothetical protein